MTTKPNNRPKTAPSEVTPYREIIPGAFARAASADARNRKVYRMQFDIPPELHARKEALGYRVSWPPTLRAAFEELLTKLEAHFAEADARQSRRRARGASAAKNGKAKRWAKDIARAKQRTRAVVG